MVALIIKNKDGIVNQYLFSSNNSEFYQYICNYCYYNNSVYINDEIEFDEFKSEYQFILKEYKGPGIYDKSNGNKNYYIKEQEGDIISLDSNYSEVDEALIFKNAHNNLVKTELIYN